MNKFSFSSSPAWSIAHRYRSKPRPQSDENAIRDGFVPGPGAYSLNRIGSKGTPSWKSTYYIN